MQGEVRNAQIADTFLGYEDHGLFIMTLFLDYGGSEQGYQRILGSKAESQYYRLADVLRVVGVQSWEKLKGRYVRARIADGLISQIGHITRDAWTREIGESAPPVEGEGA